MKPTDFVAHLDEAESELETRTPNMTPEDRAELAERGRQALLGIIGS